MKNIQKYWALLMGSLLVGCGPDSTPIDMNLEQLLLAHTEAVGGANAIESVRSLEVDLRIEEPTFSVTGSYKATRDGRMRIDIFADGRRVFIEAYDGTSGWQLMQDETSAIDMSPEGEQAVIHGIHSNIFGLHELDILGYRLNLIGREKVDGTNYWLVHSVSPAGFLKRYFINAETFLLERTRERRALHPDISAETKRFETKQSDYRHVSGRLMSFAEEKVDLDTGDVVQSTEVIRLAINPKIDAAVFARPQR
jgi:hypothetical protein